MSLCSMAFGYRRNLSRVENEYVEKENDYVGKKKNLP